MSSHHRALGYSSCEACEHWGKVKAFASSILAGISQPQNKDLWVPVQIDTSVFWYLKHKCKLGAKIKTICDFHTWRFWQSDCIKGEDQTAENSVILISSLGCLCSSTGAVEEVFVLRDRFASEEMAEHPFNAVYY